MAIMNAIDKRLWGGPLRIMASQMQTSLNCGTTQAGRGIAAIDNPYCASTTYTMRDAPEQAMSLLDSNGRPVIVVSSLLLDQTPSYGRFLLAHECCHHTSDMCHAIGRSSVMSARSPAEADEARRRLLRG